MREEFARFLEHLEYSKKRSSRTCEIYTDILEDFDKFLEGASLSEESARSFLRSRAKEISATTQALHVSVLRSLGRWLRLESNSGHAWLLKSPKTTQKKVRVFAEEDLSLLLDVISKRKEEEQILFYLLYGSALRISEALHLKWQDIDFKKAKARILGKGSKWRELPLSHQALELLKNSRVGCASESEGVWHGGVLSYAIAHKWVASWGEESGLNKKYDTLHPHLLRHALASHLLRRGGRLPHIQKLLGHSRLSTTEKYTHLDIDDLIRAYDKALGSKRT